MSRNIGLDYFIMEQLNRLHLKVSSQASKINDLESNIQSKVPPNLGYASIPRRYQPGNSIIEPESRPKRRLVQTGSRILAKFQDLEKKVDEIVDKQEENHSRLAADYKRRLRDKDSEMEYERRKRGGQGQVRDYEGLRGYDDFGKTRRDSFYKRQRRYRTPTRTKGVYEEEQPRVRYGSPKDRERIEKLKHERDKYRYKLKKMKKDFILEKEKLREEREMRKEVEEELRGRPSRGKRSSRHSVKTRSGFESFKKSKQEKDVKTPKKGQGKSRHKFSRENSRRGNTKLRSKKDYESNFVTRNSGLSHVTGFTRQMANRASTHPPSKFPDSRVHNKSDAKLKPFDSMIHIMTPRSKRTASKNNASVSQNIPDLNISKSIASRQSKTTVGSQVGKSKSHNTSDHSRVSGATESSKPGSGSGSSDRVDQSSKTTGSRKSGFASESTFKGNIDTKESLKSGGKRSHSQTGESDTLNSRELLNKNRFWEILKPKLRQVIRDMHNPFLKRFVKPKRSDLPAKAFLKKKYPKKKYDLKKLRKFRKCVLAVRFLRRFGRNLKVESVKSGDL